MYAPGFFAFDPALAQKAREHRARNCRYALAAPARDRASCVSDIGAGGAMGVAEEQLVLEFLNHGRGREIDVDAIVAMMTDDVVFQTNVPMWKPRVGHEATREELARGAAVSTGDLSGEVLSMVSDDRFVFQERTTIFEMGGKRVTLRVAAVFELVDGKIAAWREYYDSVDLARQLGVDPNLVVEG